jgi:uncharacterized protein DUF202
MTQVDSNTRLAVDRTRLSYERTMMAWVRTGTSLITFGFSIYKFFQIEIAKSVPTNEGFFGSANFCADDDCYWASGADDGYARESPRFEGPQIRISRSPFSALHAYPREPSSANNRSNQPPCPMASRPTRTSTSLCFSSR